MIHYMTGTEDNMTINTKSGCGIKSEDIGRKDCFVFWKARHKVDCQGCLDKIDKVLKLQGRQ